MILVTGATGFLGRSLVVRLLRDGREVLGVSRSGESIAGEAALAVDLTQPNAYEKLGPFGPQIEAVVHLAGRIEIALERNPTDPNRRPNPGPEDTGGLYRDNFLLTVDLAQFCSDHRIPHLLFASSQAVYGMPGVRSLTEGSVTRPLEHYALSKRMCEEFLGLSATRGLSSTILRFPGLYGPGRESGLVYNLIRSALLQEVIQLKIDYPLPLDVLLVDDVVDAFAKAVDTPANGQRILNIATGEPCSIELLAKDIASCLPAVTVEGLIPDQPIVCMDASRATQQLGWRPTPRKVALQAMIQALSEKIK